MRGLLELYNWLQGHLPANTTVDHEMDEKEKVALEEAFISHLSVAIYVINMGSDVLNVTL
ncbi:hypothetical protein Prudu_198S000100 [Prunus dulcis]|uniref:Uncharacterized protein n=1 Tax=Prunus dulcis TaxID=3755 RepID=A0A4Y1RDA2_PRUDU|nr:hypothetical protein Prudu_012413 [Prunus dulcis]BBN67821.1 hypothetical protein Prudu_198S000100 [Prunus dulcis]